MCDGGEPVGCMLPPHRARETARKPWTGNGRNVLRAACMPPLRTDRTRSQCKNRVYCAFASWQRFWFVYAVALFVGEAYMPPGRGVLPRGGCGKHDRIRRIVGRAFTPAAQTDRPRPAFAALRGFILSRPTGAVKGGGENARPPHRLKCTVLRATMRAIIRSIWNTEGKPMRISVKLASLALAASLLLGWPLCPLTPIYQLSRTNERQI